jgi:hypothetical protein
VYDNPNGWTGALGINPADTAYSIQKNLDNYPLSTGLFSVIIKSDIGKGVIGLARTGNQSQLAPAFPITGHPTSLTGYYKFLPQNGDTMNINVVLFKSGAIVAGGTLKGTATVSNWTSFNVPISSYTTADSAFIFLASCNSNGGAPIPHGNSALYVDNLNFDNLITTGISDLRKSDEFSVFPNPFSAQTTLQTDNLFKDATLTVYNSFGQTVKQLGNISGQTIIFHRDNLPNGVYFIRLTQDNQVITRDKLVITD